MSTITQSGYYSDSLGRPFLVTQGLVGYTLVDKKKILFRIFMDPRLSNPVTSVFVRIKYIGTNIPPTEILIPRSHLLIENSTPNGPSLGIIFQGNLFPNAALRYYVEFNALAENPPRIMARLVIPDLKFQKSGRLRALVKSLFGNAPWGNRIIPNIGWFLEIGQSLNRLAAMLPVSDDIVIQSNPDPKIGLSWIGGQAFDTWPNPCPSGNPPSIPDTRFPNVLRCPGGEMNSALVAEAKQLRSLGYRVDVTVAWRPRDYAKDSQPPSCAINLPITTVAASGNDGNIPQNVLDNNLNTRWSSQGVGQFITADMGSNQKICSVDIAWYKGNNRAYNFVISTSTDGITFTPKLTSASSGSTVVSEKYTIESTIARYVRVTVNGNSANKWASITELDVFGPYSPPTPGEGMGGQGMIVQGDRLATIVGGSRDGVYFTSAIMAQEVGHTFGLEPSDSPHYDGGGHSKDPFLIDPFAFDFVRLAPYNPPQPGFFLGDVMSWAWGQGMNYTLYNAFDWERLRQELVKISGLQSSRRQRLADVLKQPFAKLEKIQVQRPESALYSKPKFEWHWTDTGFRLLERTEKTRKSGLAPSAESVFSSLKELGAKEIYAPVNGKPFTILINTIAPITCYNNAIRSSGLP
jgi:F5/8 type C domain